LLSAVWTVAPSQVGTPVKEAINFPWLPSDARKKLANIMHFHIGVSKNRGENPPKWMIYKFYNGIRFFEMG